MAGLMLVLALTLLAQLAAGQFDTSTCNTATKSCVFHPSCNNQLSASCPFVVSYKLLNNSFATFEIAAPETTGTGRYTAVGFSQNTEMGDTPVTECSSLATAPYSVKLSYNTPGGESTNERIADVNSFYNTIISNPTAQYNNGFVYCKWTQRVQQLTVPNADTAKVYTYQGNNTYLLITKGPTTATDILQHDVMPVPFNVNLNGQSQAPTGPTGTDETNNQFDESKCGQTKTCYYHASCGGKLSSSCPFVVSYNMNGQYISFEVVSTEANVNGRYIALGFAKSQDMPDAPVTECSALTGQDPSVKLSYNQKDAYVNVRIADAATIQKSILSNASYSYYDGYLYCSWVQRVQGFSVPNADSTKVFTYANGTKNYLLVAKGPTSNSDLLQHDQSPSVVMIDYLGGISAAGVSSTTKLLRAHAALMILGWFLFVPIALFFARFLRSNWPEKKPLGMLIWFHIHRTSNLIGLACMIGGFVCVFCATNWTWTGPGTSASYWVRTHTAVGLASLILAWIQPFVAVFRCHPGNARRPIFNWIHRIIGSAGFILATTAIAIAAYNFELWTRPSAQLALAFVPLEVFIVLSVIILVYEKTLPTKESFTVSPSPSDDSSRSIDPSYQKTAATTKFILVMMGLLVILANAVILVVFLVA